MTIISDWALWRGCKRKRKWANPLTAELKAKKHVQTVYRCKNCGGYHLTSKKAKSWTLPTY